MSHTDDLALYAVAMRREVGVDVERIVPDRADPLVAEQFFAPAEAAAFRAQPAILRERAFFDCWTRKEAYVKALGKGLSIGLSSFEVSLAPGESSALLRTVDDSREAARWSLRDLDVGPGVSAALAVEGAGWSLSCWDWPGPSVPSVDAPDCP
jgi:4'-phosphopantetheinyl transferase